MDKLRVQLTENGQSTSPESDSFQAWLDRYLSGAHLRSPATGCPLPSVAGEIPRQSKKVRAAFTRSLQRRLDRFAALLPAGPDSSDRAIEALASAAGAILLARAVSDDELARRILTVMKKAIAGNIGGLESGNERRTSNFQLPTSE